MKTARLSSVLSIVGTFLVGLPRVAFPALLHVTCRDGKRSAYVQGFGRTARDRNVCDIDGAADGVCTFSLSGCEDCRVHLCFPDDDMCEDTPSPCPSINQRIALPLRRGRAKTKKITSGSFAYVLRCLPSRSRAVSTTTLPPLTGNWTITDTSVTDTCPPDIEQLLASLNSLSIIQGDSTVGICGDAFIAASSGPLSALGFTVDGGQCAEIGSFNYSETLSGAFVSGSADILVTRHFVMTPPGPCAPGPVVCERFSTGVMMRVTKVCASNIDCIALDPCSRCVNGSCWTNPLCR